MRFIHLIVPYAHCTIIHLRFSLHIRHDTEWHRVKQLLLSFFSRVFFENNKQGQLSSINCGGYGQHKSIRRHVANHNRHRFFSLPMNCTIRRSILVHCCHIHLDKITWIINTITVGSHQTLSRISTHRLHNSRFSQTGTRPCTNGRILSLQISANPQE